jgi:hypothetical protein
LRCGPRRFGQSARFSPVSPFGACATTAPAARRPAAKSWFGAPAGTLVGLERPFRWETLAHMDIVVAIVLVLLILLPVVFVGGLFVWAALKDGQEDRALQARLGIRRRTRLGR